MIWWGPCERVLLLAPHAKERYFIDKPDYILKPFDKPIQLNSVHSSECEIFADTQTSKTACDIFNFNDLPLHRREDYDREPTEALRILTCSLMSVCQIVDVSRRVEGYLQFELSSRASLGLFILHYGNESTQPLRVWHILFTKKVLLPSTDNPQQNFSYSGCKLLC